MKKLKLKKCNTLFFTYALTFVLSGCNYTTAKMDDCAAQYQIENGTTYSEDDSPQIIDGNIEVYLYDNLLYIEKRINESEPTFNASENLYEQINTILEEQDINTLNIVGLGKEFDFSQCKFENIEHLRLNKCSAELDTSNFSGTYQTIQFVNTSVEPAISIIENCDCSSTAVMCTNMTDTVIGYDNATYMDIDAFANSLVKSNIHIDSLTIQQFSHSSNELALTQEEIQTLCQVNTKKLNILSDGNVQFNLNATLNNTIEELELGVPFAMNTNINSELGTVKIAATNPLSIYFKYANITENTHFELPPNCNISFTKTEYTDINPFYDLENANILVFTPSFYEESIIYNANSDEFDKIIEELKQLHGLQQIKSYH